MAKGSWSRGWQLVVSTLGIMQKYPLFIVPIIIVWLIYAPIIIYLKYFFPWANFGFSGSLGIVFLTLFVFSYSILLSCSVMLELIQQMVEELDAGYYFVTGLQAESDTDQEL